MGAGALDAVNTPVIECPDACKGANALLAKIETIRKLIGAPGSGRREFSPRSQFALPSRPPACLIAVGASAGGPAAIAEILGRLPADFPAPMVIVQHVDPQFAQGLANWLDCQTPMEVRLAQENDHPEAGTVLLAGRDSHLVFVNSARLGYTRLPEDSAYSPSVDVFFRSVARFWPGHAVGVLLTGMGRDGADGLRALRRRGVRTIAQDRATSAVYGMPKAAAEIGAAEAILPLDQIAARLMEIVAQRPIAHV
jgi:chemotaxis response regulator CheB